MPSSSEVRKPFPEGPVSFVDFFRDSVQRLIQDNLDYATTASWETVSVESVAFIDESPIPGKPLSYHYAYDLVDTPSGVTKLGIIMDQPRLPERIKYTRPGSDIFMPWTQRKHSSRHYFETNQGLGIVACRYVVPGNEALTSMEGKIEEPDRLDDPLDDIKAKTLKLDLAALKRGLPVKPLTNFIRTAVGL